MPDASRTDTQRKLCVASIMAQIPYGPNISLEGGMTWCDDLQEDVG